MWIKKFSILLCLFLLLGMATAYAADYEHWFVFQDGSTGLYGYIDGEGRIVEEALWEEPPRFEPEDAWNPAPQWSVARKEGAYGLIDREGNEILPFAYESIWKISEDLFAVKQQGKSGVIRADGTEALPFAWDDLGGGRPAVQAGLLTMWQDGKVGWIDLEGAEKCPAIWDRAEPYLSRDGQVYVKVCQGVGAQRRYGIADIDGTLIAEPEYRTVGYYSESLVPVQKNQKWGYLDEAGEVALPFVYQEAENFIDFAARVKKDGEFFYINRDGEKVDPPQSAASEGIFSVGGYTIVEKNGKYGLQDAGGEMVMPYTWYALYPAYADDYFIFKRDDAQRYGVIRADGTIIIDSLWHRISYGGGDPPLFLVEKDGVYHYYDHEGELVFTWPQ